MLHINQIHGFESAGEQSQDQGHEEDNVNQTLS